VNELHCNTLWKTLKRLAKKSAVKRAAVAYVSSDDYVKFGQGDILVTDASDGAIAGGQTDAGVLARAKSDGAELYHLNGLHTKVLLLDGIVVIGSANLSSSSANSLIEAAWVTDNPAAVGMAYSLVEQLKGQAEEIDDVFIERIRKIPVTRTGGGAGKKVAKVKLEAHQTWVVGIEELIKEFPDDANDIAKGEAIAGEACTRKSSTVEWIRWASKSRFRERARPGDSIIQIWTEHGAKRPSAVYRHTPILHRREGIGCTLFFIEWFANAEDTAKTWADFQKLWKQVGVPGKVGPYSTREVSTMHADALFTMWKK
jgi:hypothetical protein